MSALTVPIDLLHSAHWNTPTVEQHKRTKLFCGYKLLNTLGEGEYGKVKLALSPQRNLVAIKLITKKSLHGNKHARLKREISLLAIVSHPNIVRLLDVLETESCIGVVMEYASGGELYEYILKQNYLKEDESKRVFRQLVNGVSYLHSINIVHRDLKLVL